MDLPLDYFTFLAISTIVLPILVYISDPFFLQFGEKEEKVLDCLVFKLSNWPPYHFHATFVTVPTTYAIFGQSIKIEPV